MAQIDVEMSRLAPHRDVAGGPAHSGVRPGVGERAGARAVIGLDLGDANRDGLVIQDGCQVRAEQHRGDVDGQAGEVVACRGAEQSGS